MASVTIESTALTELSDYFERFPEVSAQAIRMAINDVTRGKAMKMIRSRMMEEIDFTSSYLGGDRLKITGKATNAKPESIITARKRATSLARFSSGTPASTRKRGVSVRVKKGKTTFLKNAWLVRLNKGASKDEDNYNLGLAVRLGPGQTLSNKHRQHSSWLVKGSVALLYAPSVNQVFRSVADEVADPIGELVAAEYLRQMSRLLE